MAIAVKPTYRGALPTTRLPTPSAELEDALGTLAEAVVAAVLRVGLFTVRSPLGHIHVSGDSQSSTAGSSLSRAAWGGKNSLAN